MPICRICQYENPARATVCQQCGIYLDHDILHGNITPADGVRLPLPVFTLHITPQEISLSIYNDTIAIPPEDQIYIGREFPAQFSNPHIDLGPYSALEFGVSRIHARLDCDDDGFYSIVDLGSTNGTLLNNELLTAFHNYPLSTDDLLGFGDFPMLIYITT